MNNSLTQKAVIEANNAVASYSELNKPLANFDEPTVIRHFSDEGNTLVVLDNGAAKCAVEFGECGDITHLHLYKRVKILGFISLGYRCVYREEHTYEEPRHLNLASC